MKKKTNNYSFTVAITNKLRKPAERDRTSETNVLALCKRIEGKLVACINYDTTEVYAIPFTEESFDPTGKEKVFDEEHDICFIRTKEYAKAFPGIYPPLADNHLVKGDIIVRNKTKLFQLKEVVQKYIHEL